MSSTVTMIVEALAALAVILAELVSGRKTEEQARTECQMVGRLIAPGAAADELARHEEAARKG